MRVSVCVSGPVAEVQRSERAAAERASVLTWPNNAMSVVFMTTHDTL